MSSRDNARKLVCEIEAEEEDVLQKCEAHDHIHSFSWTNKPLWSTDKLNLKNTEKSVRLNAVNRIFEYVTLSASMVFPILLYTSFVLTLIPSLSLACSAAISLCVWWDDSYTCRTMSVCIEMTCGVCSAAKRWLGSHVLLYMLTAHTANPFSRRSRS